MKILKYKEYKSPTNLILIGKPGSGKGTISNLLKDEYGYSLICMGDILREEKESGSDLGKEIARLIDAGNLVPDEMVDNIMDREVTKLKKPILIDGYPRTINQAKHLDEILDNISVIWLEVSEKTTIERNLKRGKTSNRPDDSNVDVIKQRIENYNKLSLPLKEFYKNSNRLIEIDGEGTIQEVFELVKKSL
jgi:adenylate kinase